MLHHRNVRVTSAPLRKGPPILRNCSLEVQDGLFMAWLLFWWLSCRDASNGSANGFRAVPPELLSRRVPRQRSVRPQNRAEASEKFFNSDKGSSVQNTFCRSASRSTLPTMSCAWRNGMPLRTR